MQEFKFNEEQRKAVIPHLTAVESSTNMQTFTKMKEILNRIFGEENNQILKPSLENIEHIISTLSQTEIRRWNSLNPTHIGTSVRESFLNYRIVIKFAEVVVKNSRNQSIKIRDLFVVIPARMNGTLLGWLTGVTATFTPEQYRVGYMHSHLRTFTLSEGPGISQFCLGTGQITMPLAILTNKFDELNFQFLCHHLKNYVAWESIEGTPYTYMAGVISKSGPAVRSIITQELITQLVATCRTYLRDNVSIEGLRKILKWEVTDRGIKITPTEELEKILAPVVPGSARCFKDNTGEYFVVNTTQRSNLSVPDKPVIYFKGNPVKIKIDGKEENQKEIYANPSVTEKLCEWFSSQFTRTAIAAQGTDWDKDTIDNIQQTPDANPLALPAN